jgi:hypothetical protein
MHHDRQQAKNRIMGKYAKKPIVILDQAAAPSQGASQSQCEAVLATMNKAIHTACLADLEPRMVTLALYICSLLIFSHREHTGVRLCARCFRAIREGASG